MQLWRPRREKRLRGVLPLSEGPLRGNRQPPGGFRAEGGNADGSQDRNRARMARSLQDESESLVEGDFATGNPQERPARGTATCGGPHAAVAGTRYSPPSSRYFPSATPTHHSSHSIQCVLAASLLDRTHPASILSLASLYMAWNRSSHPGTCHSAWPGDSTILSIPAATSSDLSWRSPPCQSPRSRPSILNCRRSCLTNFVIRNPGRKSCGSLGRDGVLNWCRLMPPDKANAVPPYISFTPNVGIGGGPESAA